MDKIVVQWLGHSCFLITHKGIKYLFDPYKDNSVPGLKLPPIGVNKVFISHDHDDHNNDKIPCLLNYVEINYKTLLVAHDDQGGALRGMNKIHILYLDGIKIVHMGDIGCQLDYQQIQELKDSDLLLIPINGFYTISALDAYEIYKQISPKVMVPMHYYYNNTGYKDDGQIDKFLDVFKDAICLKEKEFILNDYIQSDQRNVIVLDYCKE